MACLTLQKDTPPRSDAFILLMHFAILNPRTNHNYLAVFWNLKPEFIKKTTLNSVHTFKRISFEPGDIYKNRVIKQIASNRVWDFLRKSRLYTVCFRFYFENGRALSTMLTWLTPFCARPLCQYVHILNVRLCRFESRSTVMYSMFLINTSMYPLNPCQCVRNVYRLVAKYGA